MRAILRRFLRLHGNLELWRLYKIFGVYLKFLKFGSLHTISRVLEFTCNFGGFGVYIQFLKFLEFTYNF